MRCSLVSKSRLLSAVIGFLVLLTVQPELWSQRLPKTVIPEHYQLTLTPDLKAATFTGEEQIDVRLTAPSAKITLNSAEIKFLRVSTKLAGALAVAKVTPDEDKQQATLDFGKVLPAGKYRLEIRYSGILNNELRGFYLSKTAKRNYAVTQFESTDARRAFPSFDEPAFKATFDVTLVVDQGDTAISNTNIVKDEPRPEAKHAITFARTPKMSTYLVAFLVGDFQCLTGESDGVPIRACATPDQVQYGAFALKSAEYILHYYDTYFGIKYPMPKLDMIALPDFEAGAMENFGAITYRETDLLVDSAHASVDSERNVALVVAHEMAHQWFGDMVTMQWWDNLWLNEGFATWMENKPLEAWKPEWNQTQEVAAGTQGTLDLDAQRVTRTIRAKADTPDEINEMFDGISYGKAGAVLLMVENYVGEEMFRQGVHNYLAAHLYGNATAEDFWTAQVAASHKPVDKIMESLVAQPGEPILTLGSPENGKVTAEQERFFLNAKGKAASPESWVIPVCFKAAEGESCEVLKGKKQNLSTVKGSLLFANAQGKGYYRTLYPEAAFRELVARAEAELSAEERISLLGNEAALAHAGRAPVGDLLELAGAYRSDASPELMGAVRGDLSQLLTRVAATAEERQALQAWVRTTFGSAYRLRKEAKSGEPPADRELRAELLDLMAVLGEDPEAIEQARSITKQSLADAASVDPTLAAVALPISARNGDAALFDQLQKLAETAENPQVKVSALHSLVYFRSPELTKRALEYESSGKVRNQDAAALIAAEVARRDTQDVAWEYVRANWDKVTAQFTTFGGAYVVGATAGFCSEEKVDEVTKFFAEHKVAASARALERAKDEMHDCMDLRAKQEGNLREWLVGK